MTEKLIELIENTGLIFFWVVMVILLVVIISGAILGAIWLYKNYWHDFWKGE